MFGWGVKTITADELAGKLKQGKQVLIDVREPNEFAAGHVRGAVSMPLGQVADRLGTLDPHVPTYVICQSGHRSAAAVSRFQQAGFDDVYSVKGGTSAWHGSLAR